VLVHRRVVGICIWHMQCNAGPLPVNGRRQRPDKPRVALGARRIGTHTASDSKRMPPPQPPVGGSPSRHTGTGGASEGVHDQCLRPAGLRCWGQEPSGAPKQAARQAARRGHVEQSKQLGKQPDEAMSNSRGDTRAAKRRAQEGRRQQPPNTASGSLTTKPVIVFETQGSPNSFVWQIYLGHLLYKRTGSAAGPLKLACSPSHKRKGNQGRSRVDRASGFRVTRRLISFALCRGLLVSGSIGCDCCLYGVRLKSKKWTSRLR
jgi:hypothetical protein